MGRSSRSNWGCGGKPERRCGFEETGSREQKQKVLALLEVAAGSSSSLQPLCLRNVQSSRRKTILRMQLQGLAQTLLYALPELCPMGFVRRSSAPCP